MGQCSNAEEARTSGAVAASPTMLESVVVAGPGLECLAEPLRSRLPCAAAEPSVSWETFRSGDPNVRFDFEAVAGRRVVFLFDTVDASMLFVQLSLLQSLRGFPVPDGADASTKWKTYVQTGQYAWKKAAELTVVIPWYRPCQMERTCRWDLAKDGMWNNAKADGRWLDVPCAQTLVRLLCAAAPAPPGPGPAGGVAALKPSPLELLFVELHEEAPVQAAALAADRACVFRAERFVPFFLDRFKRDPSYTGDGTTYVLFPDHGGYDRYRSAVVERLGLKPDHILWIQKTRVGGSIEQVPKLFYDQGKGEQNLGEKTTFNPCDDVLIIDDFTNSGNTLFGALEIVRGLGQQDLPVSIFVSHLVAAYDPKVIANIKENIDKHGPCCRFFTTDTLPASAGSLKDHKQVSVISIVDFLVDLLR